MIKLRTIIIILIIYIISYTSINYNINLLYPYYLVKDLIMYPVKAITTTEEIELSNNFEDSIIVSLKEEIQELKKISNIKNVLSEFNYINATVISRNREYWFNNITIDKGKKDGITLDMAVVDGDGLIGRISNVRDNSSDIKLITTNDVSNKVSVVIKDNGDNIYGITSGYDSKLNLLTVIVNDKKDITYNSKVETTGMGGIFPKGILIGEVFDVIDFDDNVGIMVRIRPSANIEGERYVSVLQRKDSN